MKIAIICGGPGAERGVSINSARSAMDHISSDSVEVIPFYFDVFMNAYQLSTAQLYSNTPSDFDFKLDKATRLNHFELISKFKEVDLVFPLIHGIFGETGELQQLLEDNNIPYIGGSAKTYRKAFPKDIANTILKENGFFTIPFVTVNKNEPDEVRVVVADFLKEHNIQRAIIKPVLGGSSIGTYDIKNADEAVLALKEITEKQLYVGDKFIVEPFLHGREFSTIVVQNKEGRAVSFVPTEIEIVKGGELFNFRKKYLPTDSSLLHCPPHFTTEQIKEIQKGSEKIFELFEFNDYVRLDGWVLDYGQILFSDINPVTGMEQCSFVFEQTARVGFTHASILRYLIENACRRYNIKCDIQPKQKQEEKKKVYVLMGGKTAERQVSLMSGTNIWLKLLKSKHFNAIPFLMDKQGEIWKLPYTFTLNHTVEEIYLNCLEADKINSTLKPFADDIYKRLDLPNSFSIKDSTPERMTLDGFCEAAVKDNAFIFIGLHGGEGENGTLQHKFEDYGLVFSGSDAKASRIGMDKCETGRVVRAIGDPDIISLPKKEFNIQTITASEMKQLWDEATEDKTFDSVAVKPLSDGCSSGIVRLYNFNDFKKYVEIAKNIKNEVIPAHTFHKQDNEINLPQDRNPLYFLEPFIQVDYIRVIKNDIVYKKHQGWLEYTVGVVEKCGEYHAFNPSITIAEGEVLSLEEKFQGGTGVNITPPPTDLLPLEYRDKIKHNIEVVARAIGIKSYSRIDIFFNHETAKMIVIEANSLPGMTPSTVIYHQALAENPPLTPIEFIEKIINDKLASQASC